MYTPQKTPPQSKSFLAKAGSFISEEAKWLYHGRPYREVEEINHIYETICNPCEFFENDGCKICGCRIVPNERSPLNKLSMATTNCPLPEQPKWTSTITTPAQPGKTQTKSPVIYKGKKTCC